MFIVTFFNNGQDEKASNDIDCTDLGMFTSEIELHKDNAFIPMLMTLCGISISDNFVQLVKVYACIDKFFIPRLTAAMLVQA